MKDIYFILLDDKKDINHLEIEWQKSLNFPNDDFWDHLLDSCQYWVIKQTEEIIGYVCTSPSNLLMQFFLTANHLTKGHEILQHFIQEKKITKARIETNNPIFASLVMHFQKTVTIHGYTFSDMEEVVVEQIEGSFKLAITEDLERLVDFSHKMLDAPKDWLTGYIGNLIEREEFFFLERNNEVIGTCEVRTSNISPQTACLGMVVSSEHRNQGIGTYLLGQAKAIAKSRNKEPMCGCGKDNIASLKAIEKNGFRILHLSLILDFMETS